ncbi:MAG: adenine phosphoribosyltransferase [candidate division Zixibacteria bacterium RBG_16_53_22]|nr:MAG: adenine phosphoribosyltransferase [candidate division Zixibacteria bacterium RBG_16_53_22]
MTADELKSKIRNVPDFPIKGIMFRDITTLVNDSAAFKYVIDKLYERYRDKGIDQIVGIESRGFIFGGALAHRLCCGFVPARKLGKLPAATIEESYELEYGRTSLQLHTDSIKPGQRVVILDDLLATGGTLRATANMVERLGGEIYEIAVVIELSFLNGREKLKNHSFYSMVQYDSE